MCVMCTFFMKCFLLLVTFYDYACPLIYAKVLPYYSSVSPKTPDAFSIELSYFVPYVGFGPKSRWQPI